MGGLRKEKYDIPLEDVQHTINLARDKLVKYLSVFLVK